MKSFMKFSFFFFGNNLVMYYISLYILFKSNY